MKGTRYPRYSLVFDKLDSIVKASSLVEMVNSLIRPYLNSLRIDTLNRKLLENQWQKV